MAEEKIRVLVAEDPCKTCKIKPCQRKCMFAVMYEKAPGMTRSEIILKIARTLKACTSGDCFEEAEYVLDSLLEYK